MSAVERQRESDVPPAAAKKPRGMLLPVIGAALVSAGVAAGAVWFLASKHSTSTNAEAEATAEHGGSEHGGGEHGEAKAVAGKKGATSYYPMTPAFVVNLNDTDSNRFLQVDMEVMARDAAVLDAVKLHTPQIRNSVLMLLGQQKFHDIDTREGKEALQNKVLAEMQRILVAETGKPGIEAVYFTSFVMQ